jgi:sodium transport system ATP-binding protein
MIEVKDLHKAFGAVKAVDGVSFIARDGEITGLLGPNGAGKTTTLRMLYTLMTPDRGQVLVDGIDAAIDPLGARKHRLLRAPAWPARSAVGQPSRRTDQGAGDG